VGELVGAVRECAGEREFVGESFIHYSGESNSERVSWYITMRESVGTSQ